MALDGLKEVIEKLQGMINTHQNYLFGKERRTRQVLIDPLLKALGWDVSDPGAVYLEHNRMDYALMSNASPIAVIEAKPLAKPLGKPLEGKVITQAITYAVENNILYIIVANGDRWEMYEVLKPGTLEDKKLMVFQLSEQSAHECALQALRIWKPNLASGSPKEAMKPVLGPPDKIKDAPAVPPAPALAIKKGDDALPIKQLYLEYWKALKNTLEQRDSGIKCRKPQPQCWMGFKVGRSGFQIHTWASRDERYISVGLTVEGTHGRSHFDRLKMSKTEIEREISPELEWQENPKQNYIRFYLRNTDLEDTEDWKRQHQWLCEQLETFHKVFVPRVEALNTSN